MNQLDDDVDTIASVLIECVEALRLAVGSWEDERIIAVADRLESNENCHGFRCEHHDVAARCLRAEVGYRHTLTKARASGLDCYCLACQGLCKGEAEHNKVYPPKSPAEMRISEMSRDKLIEMVCEIASALANDPYYSRSECAEVLKRHGVVLSKRAP